MRLVTANSWYVALWRELPVPVIAAVHGVAFGGGFQLALGADLRYVAPDTRLSVMETKWGLVPDMAGTQLMRHLAREDVVRELTYTARIFSAEEAYGFATRLAADPLAEAIATTRDIAGRSPDAIRAAKRLLNGAVACDASAGLAAERTEQRGLIGRPNHVEAVNANLEKRLPRFVDPIGTEK
jgi:enoyl-CoA hydratase/carnithine racemase